MFKDGYASFSGCLNPQLPNESLTRALDTKPGKFWHFADDRPGPDRGVYFELPNIAVWDCNVNDYVEFKIS